MSVLNGIQNFLMFIDSNWTIIAVCIAIAMSIYKKAKFYFEKSDEEKIAIAKAQVHEAVLRMITDAEIDYENWSKSGSIKRSQVIEEIFIAYPALSKVVEQDELIKWIDNEINDSLTILREIIEKNKETQ